jgi:predicted ATP-binding protein involved in virulence
MCNFRIKELTVTNYRKFEQKTFQLNPTMNVFAGKNGSGKTAALEAAVVMMGAYLSAYKTYVPSQYVFNLSGDPENGDAHKKVLTSQQEDVLTAGGVAQYPCKVSCTAIWGEESNEISFQRIIEKEGSRTKFNGKNPMQPKVVEWEEAISKADHSDETSILPLVLYLSSARLWNENNSTKKKSLYGRTEAFNHCLDKKHGAELAFGYIRKFKNVAVEERDGKSFPAYDAILDAINEAFGDELSPGERVIFSTRYERDIVALQMKDGTVVPFTSLSDGYRNVIKIIVDIATRMCILNPYQKENVLKKTPGIVVIDEIDLSLHPTWQRKIIGILKELFPKIQFICATHSPFIIQSLKEGELITLDRRLESEYSGESIEDIAEDVMGVEMVQYSIKKRKMYEAAQNYLKALEQAESQEDLDALRNEMNRLEAVYSENPAYLALIEQENLVKEQEVKDNEAGK